MVRASWHLNGAEIWKASRRFGPYLVQCTFEDCQIEPLIKWVRRQFRPRAAFDLGRERECRFDCAGSVAPRKYRREAAREVNPFPLIEVAIKLPERGQSVRQAFKVGSLLRLTFLHVPVGLAGGLVQAIVSGMASLKRLAEG